MRADKPIGSFLLLWPTLWSLWLAGEGQPSASIVLIFIVGVFLMRSAGCVINDFADRHIDPGVARTCKRPMATGKVTPREALILFASVMRDGLSAGSATQCAQPETIRRRCFSCCQLSLHETVHTPATGIPWHGLWLEHTDGFCRTERPAAARRLAVVSG